MVKRIVPKVIPSVDSSPDSSTPSKQSDSSKKSEISLSDVDNMETVALEKANKAISAIENAIAVWDATAEKSDDLKPRMIRLKYFYEAISNWERKMLQTRGKEDQLGQRVERLKEFTEICSSYA